MLIILVKKGSLPAWHRRKVSVSIGHGCQDETALSYGGARNISGHADRLSRGFGGLFRMRCSASNDSGNLYSSSEMMTEYERR